MGYRTIGVEPARVLARMIPLDLLVQEKERKLKEKKNNNKENRKQTLTEWQKNQNWTKILIPKVEKWYQTKHGDIYASSSLITAASNTFYSL